MGCSHVFINITRSRTGKSLPQRTRSVWNKWVSNNNLFLHYDFNITTPRQKWLRYIFSFSFISFRGYSPSLGISTEVGFDFNVEKWPSLDVQNPNHLPKFWRVTDKGLFTSSTHNDGHRCSYINRHRCDSLRALKMLRMVARCIDWPVYCCLPL